MMDIDYDEEDISRANKKAGKKPQQLIVPVDDEHPFDLDAYISSYSGRTMVDRLVHIMSICPTVAIQALPLAVDQLLKLRDPNLYQVVMSTYEQVSSLPNVQLPSFSDVISLDQAWIDETNAKNHAERAKLEVELKTYTSNMIKESIRMAHRDLGNFYLAVGDFSASLKHFTKSRESCTTSQHVLDMCFSVLELLLLQRNYTHIPTYVFKADAALDAATTSTTAAAAAPSAGGTSSQPAAAASGGKKSPERSKWQTKLDLASAISHLGQGHYEKAASLFLRVGNLKELGDWVGKVIAPGDIGIFATLCALASLPRSFIKDRLLQNDSVLVYIEYEPYIRELLEAYMSSKFNIVLDLLERYSTRHYVDIYLSPHVKKLVSLIRNRALVLYFQPFSSIRLDRMATAFAWSLEQVEQQVVSLIQSGDIRGRVDSQNKVLKAKETDARADLFARAIKTGKDMQATNRKLLLRMRLQQADMVVKALKGHNVNRGSEFFQD